MVLIWMATWAMLVYHYRTSDRFVLAGVILVPCGICLGVWCFNQAICSINLSDATKLLCGAVVLWCTAFHYHRKAIQASTAAAGTRTPQE